MKNWSQAIFFIFRQDSRMRLRAGKCDELFRGFSRAKYAELISGFADYVLQRELGGNYSAILMFHLALILRTFCRKRW